MTNTSDTSDEITGGRLWRVGKHYGIHVYAVRAGSGSSTEGDDTPIATAMTQEIATEIVRAHNAQLIAGGVCSNCGTPFGRHCKVHVIPCCPGKCVIA